MKRQCSDNNSDKFVAHMHITEQIVDIIPK
jgi:hypothetical protein